MANQSLAILCFFSFILLFSTFVSAEQCHPDDKKALLQIKEHFRNPDTLKTWTPNTDYCYWFQVGCDQTTYRVTFVKILYNRNTIGPIPSAIGDLPYLQVLGLSNLLNVTGPILQSITKLKNLIFLDLSSINIGGKIPEFLFELTSLTNLILSDSKFSGPLPTSRPSFWTGMGSPGLSLQASPRSRSSLYSA